MLEKVWYGLWDGVVSILGAIILLGLDLGSEEEDAYWPEPGIPSGSIAAAIASRWRPLLPGETPYERAAGFAHASVGGKSAVAH